MARSERAGVGDVGKLGDSGPAGAGNPIGALHCDALTATDISGALALSDAAGWNQTAEDWTLFIRRGHAMTYRDAAGVVVATAAALPYGGGQGWISMVLVDKAFRHRGLASALLDACVARLQAEGQVPVLDATPDGAAVYRQLGFEASFEIERWQRRTTDAQRSAMELRADEHAQGPAAGATPRRASAADLATLVALDRKASGLDREFLIESFLSRPGTRAWLSDDRRGFVIAREGRRAVQLGPLVAADAPAAIALLEAALDSHPCGASRGIFVDVLVRGRDVVRWLERRGFSRQRSFVRMSLGAPRPLLVDDTAFIIAGPEFG